MKCANNDICYQATIVVGSIINALKSGKYNLEDVAIIITRTGGQCRASNYYSLIKNAMVRNGLADVPVVSLAIGEGISNMQPRFQVSRRKLLRITIEAMLFEDALYKLYYPAAVREKSCKTEHAPSLPCKISEKTTYASSLQGNAHRLFKEYSERAIEIVRTSNRKALRQLMAEAVRDFTAITDFSKKSEVCWGCRRDLCQVQQFQQPQCYSVAYRSRL